MPPRVREQVEKLQDRDGGIRASAAYALGYIGHESAIPHLVEALKDRNWYTRSEVVKALGVIGRASVVPHLLQACHDSNWAVRRQAEATLWTIQHEGVVPHLTKALQDPQLRRTAADALLVLGRALQGKEVRGKEAKALQLVAAHFHADEGPKLVEKAYRAALKGKVTKENARLYVKQLRAVEGSVK